MIREHSIFRQAVNGLHVRMPLLTLLLEKD